MAVSDWESDWMNNKQDKASEYDSKGMRIPVVAPAPVQPAIIPTAPPAPPATSATPAAPATPIKPAPVAVPAATPALATPATPAPTYNIGSSGTGVSAIQQQLKDKGFDPGPIDGIYGPQTAAAVKAFQTKAGIAVDGIYGSQSAGAMANYNPLTGAAPATPAAPTASAAETAPTVTDWESDFMNSKQGQASEYDAKGMRVAPATTALPTPTGTTQPAESGGYVSPYTEQLKGITDVLSNYPDYKSPFTGQIQQVLNEVLNSKFSYDPSTDTQLQGASKELSRIVMEEMNKRGILNSTITQDRLQQEIAKLIPQFRQIRQGEFNQELQRKTQILGYLDKFESENYGQYKDKYEKVQDMADFVLKLDEQNFNVYKEALAQRIKEKELAYKQLLDEIELERKRVQDAWTRVNNMGFVDNESSIILKIDPSTPALSVQNNIQKRLWEIEDRDAKIQAALDKDAQNFTQQVELTKIKEEQEMEKNSASRLGTPEQVKNYYNLRDIYFGGGSGKYKDDPQSAYKQLLSNAQANIDLVGDKLYNQLKSDLKEYASSQPKKEDIKPSDYKTNPDYAGEVTYINENPKDALKDIQASAKDLIAKYGYDGYAELVKLADAAQLIVD